MYSIGLTLIFLLFFTVKTNKSEEEIQTFRLQNYVHPVHYELVLDMYVPQKSYMGVVDITLMSDQEISMPSRRIELNSNGFNLDSYSIELLKGDKTIKIGIIIEQDSMEKLIFILTEDLEAGTKYKLHIEFSGSLTTEDDSGLLLRSFTDENNETREYIMANLYPIHARKLFPCFDEPHIRATFNLTLSHPPGMKSLSTMPILSLKEGLNIKGEKIIWSIFQESPRIAPSSIGLFISEMEHHTEDSISIWATTKNRAEEISNLPHFHNFLSLIQNVTSLQFQLPSLSFVCLPDLHIEALESFGIIYLRSNELEEKLEVDSISGSIISNLVSYSDSFVVNVAKLVAAQYFGNSVSPKWWTDVWLGESLSLYYGLIMATTIDKTWSDTKLISSIIKNQVLDTPFRSLDSFQIEGDNFNSTIELIETFSRSRTYRGVSLLFMLSEALGQDIFQKGLSSFLEKYLLSSADTNDLIMEWENQLKSDNIEFNHNLTLKNIIQSWLYSKETPVLNVTRMQQIDYSSLRISQSSNAPNSKTRWYIPLMYITASEMDYSSRTPVEHWLGPNMEDGVMIQNASAASDWILFNPSGSGLFRVSYDSINWELLIRQLQSNYTRIPMIGRAQLIADMFILANDGRVLYSNALKFAEYLVNETNYLPWHSAYEAFDYLDKKLHHKKELYESFQNYVGTLIHGIYKQLGFDFEERSTKSEEEYLDILLRAETIARACKYGIDDCTTVALSSLKQYLAGNMKGIRDEYWNALFCSGLSNADAHTWREVYNLVSTTTGKRMRTSILLGLGCSKDTQLIDSYLNMTTTGELTAENVIDSFTGISRVLDNYDKVMDFLEKNFQHFENRYGNDTLRAIIIVILQSATTLEQVGKLENISSRFDDNEDLLIALKQKRKEAQEFINWMIKTEKNFNMYFNITIPTPPTTVKPSLPILNTSDEYSSAIRNPGNILLLCTSMIYLIKIR